MEDSPRLIEVAFPLKQVSLDSVHEKNVRHGHISTLHIWPARRPLAACRAALIATLLPDPGDEEKRREIYERMAGKVIEVEKNGKIVEQTQGGILHWGRESGPDLEWFRKEIRKAYGGRAPKVLDPFAGGGSIPLEAMRLGCEATAIDINPVAWFILKCTLEYPQKLAGQKYRLPDFVLQEPAFMEKYLKAKGYKGARLKKVLERFGGEKAEQEQMDWLGEEDIELDADLSWHVMAWGLWVLNQARKDLARFYPTYADFLPAAGLRPSAQTSLPANLPIPERRGVFFVYVLKCSDGSFYIGLTDNLHRRFGQHMAGEVSWTASRRPVELVHWEEYAARQKAAKREEELKTGFGRKWLKREYEAKRLRAQLYEPKLVPLAEDGSPDIERLNREFKDPFSSPHNKWRKPEPRLACATKQGEVAGRWVAKPTVAYLWARTVTCKNCRATVRLLKTRWLCKKADKRVVLTMVPNKDKTGVVFGVGTDVPVRGGNAAQRREHDRKIGGGTMSRSGATCPCCGVIQTMDDIRYQGKLGKLGAVMTAVVVDGQKGKEYRLATHEEIKQARRLKRRSTGSLLKSHLAFQRNQPRKVVQVQVEHFLSMATVLTNGISFLLLCNCWGWALSSSILVLPWKPWKRRDTRRSGWRLSVRISPSYWID